jgi:hypothetical protein
MENDIREIKAARLEADHAQIHVGHFEKRRDLVER